MLVNQLVNLNMILIDILSVMSAYSFFLSFMQSAHYVKKRPPQI